MMMHENGEKGGEKVSPPLELTEPSQLWLILTVRNTECSKRRRHLLARLCFRNKKRQCLKIILRLARKVSGKNKKICSIFKLLRRLSQKQKTISSEERRQLVRPWWENKQIKDRKSKR